MLWRRSFVYLSMSLAAPLLPLRAARAQPSTAPESTSSAPGALPPSAAPPGSTPSPGVNHAPASTGETSTTDRPSLVPSPPTPADSATSAAASTSAGVNPARDSQTPTTQGGQRPAAGELPASPREVFSDDWWRNARPIVEFHGYFRTRAELFHNFSLGRHGSTTQGNDPQYLFPIPLDQSYTLVSGNSGQAVAVCGNASSSAPKPAGSCSDKTETGANLRLRLSPEIHISDNLRILTQIDLLDNLVLGSTPDAYTIQPSGSTSSSTATAGATRSATGNGYQSAGVNGYAPVGLFTTTQGTPTAGVNGWTNSIAVKRVWGEYMTPVGQIRFGRMPGHWGLGMVENSGDGIDSDYQTTLDRIMFVTGFKSIDLYFGGAWDFVSTGPTNANPYTVYGGQPSNTCNLCNVNEWAAFIAHRTNPEMQRLSLARGDVVLNGGLYSVFRSQYIDVAPGQTPLTADFSQSNT
ncbi:MAG: TIGR04551 family protein, partial [Myxococcota bacterium]|nr:TIGR04551 family protein [Myxococcota bacterium]